MRVPDVHLLDLLQQGELVRFEPFVAFLFNHDEILVIFQLFDNAVNVADILVNLAVNQRDQKGLAHFLHPLHHLVIIVNVNEARDQPLVFVFLDIGIQFRHVRHVKRDEILLAFRNLQQGFLLVKPLHGDHVELHPVVMLPALQFQLHVPHVLFGKHAAVQFGNQLLYVPLVSLYIRKNVPETVIRPDHPAIRERDRVRHRHFLQKDVRNSLVLHGKFKNLIQHPGAVIKIQRHHDDDINHDEYRHQIARLAVDKIHPDVQPYQKQGHQQRPPHVHPELALQLYIVFHDSSPFIKPRTCQSRQARQDIKGTSAANAAHDDTKSIYSISLFFLLIHTFLTKLNQCNPSVTKY